MGHWGIFCSLSGRPFSYRSFLPFAGGHGDSLRRVRAHKSRGLFDSGTGVKGSRHKPFAFSAACLPVVLYVFPLYQRREDQGIFSPAWAGSGVYACNLPLAYAALFSGQGALCIPGGQSGCQVDTRILFFDAPDGSIPAQMARRAVAGAYLVQRPLAPQGSVMPLAETGRPISEETVCPPSFLATVAFRR